MKSICENSVNTHLLESDSCVMSMDFYTIVRIRRIGCLVDTHGGNLNSVFELFKDWEPQLEPFRAELKDDVGGLEI